MDAPETCYPRTKGAIAVASTLIAEDDDLFGAAVQLAARICDRAEPGQVLVSNVVRELCAGKKLSFRRHSGATLKGFDEPVRAWSVAWE
jgi:class 3 adenylate cyclase